MPEKRKSQNTRQTRGRPVSAGERRVRGYMKGNLNSTNRSFHLKLKHVLGGLSLLSLLAAFEVFSIPAANGIIDLFQFSKFIAGVVWFSIAGLSGGAAVILHEEEI